MSKNKSKSKSKSNKNIKKEKKEGEEIEKDDQEIEEEEKINLSEDDNKKSKFNDDKEENMISTCEYLERTVVSVLQEGLLATARVKPQNPLEFLGNYILNKAKKNK